MSDINEALREAVKACAKMTPKGPEKGSKVVGPALWPEKDPEAAQRLLLDCLNPDNSRHLTPEQLVLVARLAKARGSHVLMETLCAELGYAPPVPISVRDELSELQRQFVEAFAGMRDIVSRIERLAPEA